MPVPPIIPGLTETAETSSYGDLLGMMASQDGQPTSGMSLLKEAMGALNQAAKLDPKLAQRIARAVAVIEGNDPQSVRDRESSAPKERLGPVLGNAKTPV